MLQRWGLEKPEIIADVADDAAVVIVDTNNPAELPANINGADVQAIIDHHKLVGGLETKGPIDITIRPLACTATIMHDLMGDDAAKMPEAVKGAALTCILSDTLEFRSPTTTAHDKAVAEKLAGELGINISEYAAEMFAAKSDVSSFSDAELIRMDSKEYEVDGTKFRVSVLETTAPGVVLDRKASLMDSDDLRRGRGRRRSGAAVRGRHPERRSHPAGAERPGENRGRQDPLAPMRRATPWCCRASCPARSRSFRTSRSDRSLLAKLKQRAPAWGAFFSLCRHVLGVFVSPARTPSSIRCPPGGIPHSPTTSATQPACDLHQKQRLWTTLLSGPRQQSAFRTAACHAGSG